MGMSENEDTRDRGGQSSVPSCPASVFPQVFINRLILELDEMVGDAHDFLIMGTEYEGGIQFLSC
jgi:hypothetical protein